LKVPIVANCVDEVDNVAVTIMAGKLVVAASIIVVLVYTVCTIGFGIVVVTVTVPVVDVMVTAFGV